MKRKITSALEAWKGRTVVRCLVVKGLRGVGKTSAIVDFLQRSFDDWVRVDLSDSRAADAVFGGKPTPVEVYRRISAMFPDRTLVPRRTVIFVDGLHCCHSARDALDAVARDGRYRMVVACSMLSGGCSNPAMVPSLYRAVVQMRPMDFEEFLWAEGVSQEEIDLVRESLVRGGPVPKDSLERFEDEFRRYCVVGGMPAAVAAYVQGGMRAAHDAQDAMIADLAAQIREWAPERDADRTVACVESIPSQIAAENKKFMFARVNCDVPPILDSYDSAIDWLVAAGYLLISSNLSEPVPPLESRVRRNNFRLYGADVGLTVRALGEEAEKAVLAGDTEAFNGAVTENAVADCLAAAGLRLHFFARESLTTDFIVQAGDTVAAVEAKSPNRPCSKTIPSVRKRFGVGRGIKLERTSGEIDRNGVEHYPLFAAAFIGSIAGTGEPLPASWGPGGVMLGLDAPRGRPARTLSKRRRPRPVDVSGNDL